MDAVLRGLRHRYVVEGQGDAPVLLVMGFGFSGKAWRPQVAAFAPRHPVVWYDNRGVGESEPASSPYGTEDLADDAAALLDHLSWARAHVVGVSMGGMVAQELALRHRARLRSLTLIATMAGGRLGKLPTARGLACFAGAQLRQGPGRLEALARLLYPPGTQPEPGVIQPGFERPPPRQTIGWQLRAILRHETRARLSSLAGLPTLVVKPARDILVRPGHSDVLHRAIPGSRLVTFDDAGHGITAQCATRLNAALLAHIAEADARA